MKTDKQDIFLEIKNTSASPQNVVLFDVVGAYNAQNSAMQNTKYQWDITAALNQSILFDGQSTVTVLAAQNPGGLFQLFSFVNPTVFANADQVVAGMNTLGIGTFSNIGNIVTSFNQEYTISSINIWDLATAVEYEDLVNTQGSLIYAPGFSVGLIGAFTRINTANPFWINDPVDFVNGPFNRSAIATDSTGTNQKRNSFFFQINAAAAKTVYIGCCFFGSVTDFGSTLFMNNTPVWSITTEQQADDLTAFINGILGTSVLPVNITREFFYIVPVNLVAGNNLFQWDGSGPAGLEVYDNTAAEIAAATDYSGLNLLYSSRDYVGQQLF